MSFNGTHTPTRAEVKGKAKYQVKMYRGKGNVMTYRLYGNIRKKFIELFPTTPNREMMRLFGLSFVTVQRFKRQLGLQKDMDVIKHKQAQQIKRLCERNGWYDSLRGKAPSEACQQALREWWQSDEHQHPVKIHRSRMTDRQIKAEQRRKSKARKALIESERKRVSLGLTPKTDLPINLLGGVRKYSRQEVYIRWYAYKVGYCVPSPYEPEDRYTIFYDDETVRRDKFEQSATKKGFTFKKLNSQLCYS